MKRLFVPFVALATTVLVFTSCGDESKPTIALPEDALIIDLGDKAAALVGVKAEDKKNDLTDKIEVKGLDFVGVGVLEYIVSNDNGTTTEKRDVTIKSDELFGSYSVKEGGTSLPDAEVKKSSEVTRVVISGFSPGVNYTFEGDGKSTSMRLVDPVRLNDGDDTNPDWFGLEGKISYQKKANGDYEIYLFEYTKTYEDDGQEFETTLTFVKQ